MKAACRALSPITITMSDSWDRIRTQRPDQANAPVVHAVVYGFDTYVL
jgi:hypothetical protein